MNIQLQKKFGPRLFTRFDGASLRDEIESTLEHSSENIRLDFTDVQMVSPSFADECFGKLLFKMDAENIFSRIKFENISPLTEAIFSGVLRRRLIYA